MMVFYKANDICYFIEFKFIRLSPYYNLLQYVLHLLVVLWLFYTTLQVISIKN